jgi:hypothetical protein
MGRYTLEDIRHLERLINHFKYRARDAEETCREYRTSNMMLRYQLEGKIKHD